MSTEDQTRKTLIDVALRLAGWRLDDPTHVVEEYRIDRVDAGTAPSLTAEVGKHADWGHLQADYALLSRGRVLAVVEAKKTAKAAELGQEQALTYARNIEQLQGGHPPFVLYTNGHDIYLWEVDHYPPIKVAGFPSPLDLEWLDQRRQTRSPLSAELIDTSIAGRDYQIAAIRSILEGVEAKRRHFLLVMATGTGKTRTAMGLIDVLLRARWAKRVLFLVDRIALRDQAIEAFREHLPDSPHWPRIEGTRVEQSWDGNRRLYCATYPTMLNLIQGATTPDTWISPHFFDLIIADESHRSLFAAYKQVLQWFAGIRVGLTATPIARRGAQEGDPYLPDLDAELLRDTFQLFHCPVGDPTYAYTYQQAVEHVPPYLSDFEVLRVRSKFQLEGIRGGVLPPAVQKQLVAEGKDLSEIDFEGTDLEYRVTNAGTNALIVREFMEESIKDPTGTLPGKSIFFAISMGHARRLAALFDKLYPEHAGKLARVLVSEDRFVYGKGGLLDQFKHQDMPRVAISVDMLDTGVDVPEVVNLVFAKPVYSYTKFWQMIGRGTRVLDPGKLKPWCPAKDRFLIIDCWGNFEFFQMHPKGKEPGEQVALPVRLFRARLDQLEAALAAGREDAAAHAVAGLRADLAALPRNNAVVAEAAATLERVGADTFWQHLGPADLGLLRSVVAPVLRVRSGVESKAMRFETEVVDLGTALVVDNGEAVELLRESVLEQVRELPLSVNVVAAEQALIQAVQGSDWWEAPSPADLADLAGRLAPLMRYRQQPRDPMMSLDLADLRVVKEKLDFGTEHAGLTTSAYRERVEAYVRALVEENEVMRRIAEGAEPGEDELQALAALLAGQDPAITEDVLRKVYDVRSARLVRLLRHVLGLERLPSWPEAVTVAFDEFIAAHTTLTELQIRFLQTLRTFLLQNRRLERKDLLDAPFTQLHPRGIRGVFRGGELEEVLALAEGLVA
ncbi:DEAD/DEAH box helicase family protein [Myxococcota bacterium]|nr:DEAD/DEAH box helicase family protein [Myxococcota bacterium]